MTDPAEATTTVVRVGASGLVYDCEVFDPGLAPLAEPEDMTVEVPPFVHPEVSTLFQPAMHYTGVEELCDQIMDATGRAMSATKRCMLSAGLADSACSSALLAMDIAINANNSQGVDKATEMAIIAVDVAIEAVKEADDEASTARQAVVKAIGKESDLQAVTDPSRVTSEMKQSVLDAAKAADVMTHVVTVAAHRTVETMDTVFATAAFIPRAEK